MGPSVATPLVEVGQPAPRARARPPQADGAPWEVALAEATARARSRAVAATRSLTEAADGLAGEEDLDRLRRGNVDLDAVTATIDPLATLGRLLRDHDPGGGRVQASVGDRAGDADAVLGPTASRHGIRRIPPGAVATLLGAGGAVLWRGADEVCAALGALAEPWDVRLVGRSRIDLAGLGPGSELLLGADGATRLVVAVDAPLTVSGPDGRLAIEPGTAAHVPLSTPLRLRAGPRRATAVVVVVPHPTMADLADLLLLDAAHHPAARADVPDGRGGPAPASPRAGAGGPPDGPVSVHAAGLARALEQIVEPDAVARAQARARAALPARPRASASALLVAAGPAATPDRRRSVRCTLPGGLVVHDTPSGGEVVEAVGGGRLVRLDRSVAAAVAAASDGTEHRVEDMGLGAVDPTGVLAPLLRAGLWEPA